MAKLTAWLVTLAGVILVLNILGVAADSIGTATTGIMGWILALAVLVIGVSKLIRNYSK
ncbi:MAG: hypothetical protein AABX65_01985 [Nanoarchaeota archaeon]